MTDKLNAQIQALAHLVTTIQGELLGTQAAVRALILAHPDPLAAQRAAIEQIERLLAAALPSKLDDAFVAGIDKSKQRLLPSKKDLDELRRK
jgi:hypothetical protein